jgi:nitroreductase
MAVATGSDMGVYQAIGRRRTIKQYTKEAISRDVIERLLEAATWAPNHHLTQPWRFAVLTGEAKDGLAALRRRQVAERMPDATTVGGQTKLEETYRKMAGAAALIVVTAKGDADPVVSDENRLATAAATENILLAATAEGLASFWSSGIAPYPPARAYLDLPADESIIAVVHLGYSELDLPGRRRSAGELTRWLDVAPTASR